MIKNKKAFTLVELIVVIVILSILWTLAFISMQWYSQQAKESKILTDVRNLASAMEVKLSKWNNLDNLVISNRTDINWVDTWSTIEAGKFVLWDLKYEVWVFDFKQLQLNRDNFIYDNKWEKRDYIFAYVKAPNKLSYQFAGQIYNTAGKYDIIIRWNYVKLSSSDARWLVSESWSDIGLVNGQTLTWSLY